MKFITVATQENDGLKLLQKSCDHFGIDLKVLGLGQPYHGNGTKIHYISEYLKDLKDKEIIFFTDAYDSFFVRTPDELEEAFKAFNSPVLFSCEDNYYFRIQAVQNVFLNPYYRWRYPKSKSKFEGYRYLNSGGYMGYAGEVLELLTKTSINMKMHSDQVNLHRHFVNHPGEIALDYDHEIFTNYGKFAEQERFSVQNDVLINNLTESKPYIFHFPGPKHRGMYEFAAQFSFLK
jgi:hypothetical protein